MMDVEMGGTGSAKKKPKKKGVVGKLKDTLRPVLPLRSSASPARRQRPPKHLTSKSRLLARAAVRRRVRPRAASSFRAAARPALGAAARRAEAAAV